MDLSSEYPPKKLYKYVPTERVSILQDLKIRFTPADEYNDPFEVVPRMAVFTDDDVRTMARDFVHGQYVMHVSDGGKLSIKEFEKQFPSLEGKNLSELRDWINQYSEEEAPRQTKSFNSKNFGSLCLCEERDNLLMWAHYADSHRGLVIEFDGMHPFFTNSRRTARIKYQEERPIYNVNLGNFADTLLCKSVEWCYEKEWRTFAQFKELDPPILKGNKRIHLAKLPPESLISVTLGCQSSDSTCQQIKAALENNSLRHVIVEKAQMETDRFGLRFVKIDL